MMTTLLRTWETQLETFPPTAAAEKIALLDQVLASDPSLIAARNRRASLCFTQQRFEQAFVDFKTVRAQEENAHTQYTYYHFSGKLATLMADHPAPLDLVEHDPTWQAYVAMRRQSISSLPTLYTTLLAELAPDLSTRFPDTWAHLKQYWLYYKRAFVYYHLQQYALMAADLTTLMTWRPQWVDLYLYRSECYRKMNDVPAAHNDLAQASTLSPNSLADFPPMLTKGAFQMTEFSLPEQTPCILKDPTCAGLAIDATCPRCGQQGLSQSLLETTGYTAFQEAFAWHVQNEQALATQYVALEKTLTKERQNQAALQKKLTTQAAELEKNLTKERQAQANREATLQKKLTAQAAELEKTLTKERQAQANREAALQKKLTAQAAELEKTLTKERQAQANREATLQKKLTAQSAELEKTLTKERQNQATLQKALEETQQAYLKLEQEKKQLFSQAWHKIKTLTGHTDSVRSVGYSSCGKYVVSGGEDKTLKLWEVATGQCVQTLTGHTDSVWSVGYSPCGQYVVSGSDDKTVKLWEVATGQCVQTLTGHTNSVWSVGYSPCGQYVVSGSYDKTVKLWEVATGQCVQTLTGHTSSVRSVGYSPCGKYVVSGSEDKTVKLWEVATGKCVQILTGHEDWVLSVGYSPCRKYVISGSYDKTVKLWEVATGACLRTFQTNSRVYAVTYAPSGHTFIVGAGRDLQMWRIADRVDV